MSFYEDFVADGICCSICGELIDEKAPGYVRECADCKKRKKK